MFTRNSTVIFEMLVKILDDFFYNTKQKADLHKIRWSYAYWYVTHCRLLGLAWVVSANISFLTKNLQLPKEYKISLWLLQFNLWLIISITFRVSPICTWTFDRCCCTFDRCCCTLSIRPWSLSRHSFSCCRQESDKDSTAMSSPCTVSSFSFCTLGSSCTGERLI